MEDSKIDSCTWTDNPWCILDDFQTWKFVCITCILAILPVLQTVVLLCLKLWHPIIRKDLKDEGYLKRFSYFLRKVLTLGSVVEMTNRQGRYKQGHSLAAKRKGYKNLCLMMKRDFEGTKHWAHVKEWLTLKEINVNQSPIPDDAVTIDLTTTTEDDNDYQPPSEKQNKMIIHIKKMKDGRTAKMWQCEKEFEEIKTRALDNSGSDSSPNVSEKTEMMNETTPLNNSFHNVPEKTEMMIIINHHIRMMRTVEFLKQLNTFMVVSNRTDVHWRGRLDWRGLIGRILKVDPSLTLPDALRYSVVRALSDNIAQDWDKSEKGHEFDPHAMIIDPWVSLEKNAFGYIDSFLVDVWIHSILIWFVIVTLVMFFWK